MKTWWQQLNLREQRLVMAMSAVITIFILYGLIWQPLNESIASSKLKIDRQQTLLTWVEESTQRYQLAKRNGRNTKHRKPYFKFEQNHHYAHATSR